MQTTRANDPEMHESVVAPRTAAERGREVRQRLLRAAVELIPEIGWTAVSTRTLAQRAGVAPALVHYHFESLQALLRTATVNSMRESLAAVEAIFAHAETSASGLDMLFGVLDTYSGTDPASLLFIEAYLAALRDAQLRQELAAMVLEFDERFAHWLASHGQLAPEATAALLAACLDGILLHRALNPRLRSAELSPVVRRMLVSASPGARMRPGASRKGAVKQ
jgi:AcrR family transcriptional regulator